MRRLPPPRVPETAPAPLPADAEQLEVAYGISAVQVLTIMRSYWKVTAAITFMLAFAAAIVIKYLPKTYTATATLIVNAENTNPLASPVLPANGLDNYVATQVELITSPVVLVPVVDQLSLVRDPEYAKGFRGGAPGALRDFIEKKLAARINVDEGRGGELLYISASARNALEAAAVTNAVADVYLNQQRERARGPAEERARRYSDELAELRDKATAAQDKVTQFRRVNGITDVTASANDNEQQALTGLEQRLLAAQSDERVLEAKEAGQQSSADETLQSAQVQQLKLKLDTLHTELAQADQVLGPRNPKILELNSEISTTQNELTQAIATLSTNTSTELQRAQRLEKTLEAAVAAQRTKLLHLRQIQDEGAKLELELESAQAVYKRALDGYDQTLFGSVGDSTTVTVISRATPPILPSKPNKVKLAAMAALASLLLGIALPLLYELLIDRRVRCRDDIERTLGIPVLAELGAMQARATV